MCEKLLSRTCKCTDYLLPKYEKCHPLMCHNASICKLRKLLDEHMSADCFEQHTFLLIDYIKYCKCGFYLNDLLHLTRVLEVLAERVEKYIIYRPYFKKLLDIAAMPLLIHNCAEELTEMIYFSEYMSVIGLLTIWLNDIKLRFRVYKAIVQFISKRKQTEKFTVKPASRFKALENSHLPEIITQLIEIASKEEYYEVLNIALMLTDISPTICHKMGHVGILDYLLLRLVPHKDNIFDEEILKHCKRDEIYLEVVNVTCQILIMIITNIKHLDHETLTKITPSLNSVWTMRYILRGLLFRKDTNVCRNSLLLFIMMCLDIFPYMKVAECNLLDDIILLSTATEMKFDNWVKDVPFTNSELDIYFKKMLILTLSYAKKYVLFFKLFENRKILPALLNIVSIDYETDWPKEEHENLISYALTALCNIAPAMIENFMENKGILRLMINIEKFILAPNPCDKFKIRQILKVLLGIVETVEKNLPHVVETMRERLGVSILCSLCAIILENNSLSFGDQELLSYIFTILSFIVTKSTELCPCLKIVRDYFKRAIKPHCGDSCSNPRTEITAINLLWSIVDGNDERLKMFINMQGVYLLLDLIDKSIFPVQVIGLGCLVDMCENGFTIPFLLTWRGGKDKKTIFYSLLGRIFREECKKIGTRLNSNDIVLDTQYPLVGEIQLENIMSPTKDCQPSSALTDMIGSARPKIYALMQLLQTRYQEKTELVNEHYKIANIPIPRNDTIILHLAKNYFALKLCEAWVELQNDVMNSTAQPIDIDVEMLVTITDQMQMWNESVQKEQEIILQSEITKEVLDEKILYEALKKCRLQQAIEALREMKYFASTTDSIFKLAYKERQVMEIERYLADVDKNKLRRTYRQNLNVTAIFHQNFDTKFNLNEKGEEPVPPLDI